MGHLLLEHMSMTDVENKPAAGQVNLLSCFGSRPESFVFELRG